MRSDKTQAIANMNPRQKITAAVLVVILIIVIWQVVGMFGGSKATPPMERNASQANAMRGNTPATPPQQVTPQPAELMKQQQATSPREAQLMMLQQETQAKYIAALNELQMLKISREIAETNQAIATAKLATVTAEKNIVNLLAPPQSITPTQYSRGLVNPVSSGNVIANQNVPQQMAPSEINYSVISVSQLQYRWGAVIGYQGNLYSVYVGDHLPADGSRVVSIDKSGVVLEKDGVKRKLSLVPII